MNRDDILKMEAGPELDALVAEHVMGWEWRNLSCGWLGVGTNEFIPSETWAPSTDMAAAWMVLEVLRNMFFSTKIIMWDHTESVVIICRPRQGHDECLPDLEVEARTLPLAICRATLFAKWSL